MLKTSLQNSLSIVLTKSGLSRFFGRHPWLRDHDFQLVTELTEPTDVTILSPDGVPFGSAFFEPQSEIALRILSHSAEKTDLDQLISDHLHQAITRRASHHEAPFNGARRVVFSESDQLPGLVVDQFGSILVAQFGTWGMWRRKDLILSQLKSALNPSAILLKRENDLQSSKDSSRFELVDGSIPESHFIEEHGIRYQLDFQSGQKTGFYLDQNSNRLLAQSLAEGRSCLDLYCYSGGFSFNLARGGAKSVLGIDSSPKAVELAETNRDLNRLSDVQFLNEDAVDYLKQTDQTFDLIVLDPPKFCKKRQDKERALKKYFLINDLALKRLNPNGRLMTFSCSGAISSRDLEDTLAAVFRRNHFHGQILHTLHQGPDHPVLLACPETRYLKGLVLQRGI